MSNEYYTPSGWPAKGALGASADADAEMALVQAGFDKLPTLAGNGGNVVSINSGGTGMTSLNEAAFKTAFNLEIGVDVQAYHALLAAIAGLTPTDTYVIQGNGSTFVMAALTVSDISDIAANYQPLAAVLTATTASFTTALATKLSGIEDGATADMTGAEIKAAYEAEADTNAYDDAAVSKLAGIDSGAQVNASDVIIVCLSDEVTALTTGNGVVTFRMPFAMTLTAVRASVKTAPTGAAIQVDINKGGSTILSTKLTIDAGEKTSTTAATPAVISDASLADDAEITVDIDQVGSSVAGAGLKLTLIGTRA